AAAGRPLAEVARLAREAAAALGTMGVALGACTVPAAGKPGFELAPEEIELGLGIHGEQGVARGAMQEANALAALLLRTIAADLDLKPGARVVVLVNGLGGTPPMELAIIARAALGWLRGQGLVVERAWAGNYLTALEMPGCSLSLMVVDDARLALLDAPAEAPAWTGGGRIAPERRVIPAPAPQHAAAAPASGPLAETLRQAILAAAGAMEQNEAELTRLDSQAGDGDLGISMARGAAAIRALPPGSFAHPEEALRQLGDCLRRAIGGSSGPFYATALLRAARRLGQAPRAADWAEAFSQAVQAIGDLGGARPGDRTMLDALHPAAEAFQAALKRGEPAATAWGAAV
ncbi:dihydroxyacetone kinase subunit DhaK, partial [Teichococcus wenyumeiae]